MADNNQPQNDNSEYSDDPAFNARLRRDISAALTPTEQEGAFRSRRSAIMAQLRAEATPTAESTPAPALEPVQAPAPVKLTDYRTIRQSTKRSSFSWLGTVAAILAVLVVGGFVITLNVNNPNLTTQATNVQRISGVESNSGSVASADLAATNSPVNPAAAIAPFAPVPGPLSTGSTENDNAAGSAASKLVSPTEAQPPVAPDGANGTMNVATGGSQPDTTPKVFAGAVNAAAMAEVPTYEGATPVTLKGNAPGVRLTLTSQATKYITDPIARTEQGLGTDTINKYVITASKLQNTSPDTIANFYVNLTQQGYTLVSDLILQDDEVQKTRWVYLTRGNQPVGIYIVEAGRLPEDSALKLDAGLTNGDTAIFVMTLPQK